MKTILNIIWLVLAGFWMAVGYAFAGILCFILIITIPFGIASFRMANYALWPFGRTIERKPTAGAMSVIGNILWIVLAGWWLVIGHVVTGLALCATIIGIPLGIASFKMVPVSLVPLGAQIVPTQPTADTR
ncbi:MAG TPA: YccF domain-containing protein [Gordonia sp. (in: high G+C Gram-positive bacteria)]|uniref:YccF domain-containing protein n=1 Tax=unclassified Gordonia (in: high G+C Gram-positive bacteria) TaxID=2657482 RepID=UPI000FA85F58|nr:MULTISPECIES: YccF domain-containing protein [unclassified Gordonia (in: high G+C Gram-positive bacteria)]RUP38963.1 MAG: YccF domain-containing protein [Gordonia sp. (in: high G+C Gram-positive bacteria)]HNP56422.1 YccF domain-containing protein [Gordonia sp. (in: high G+C Gram-positive bacteria)]HRC51236.1 YccF domain-containing protein [Gordonia sp. (in: high G+C Gram-positive bacteria)]